MNQSPPSADAMLQDALTLHRQGNLAGAMERYVKVLQGDPQNADALHYIAVVAMQDGQYEEGIKLAQRALAAGTPQARTHNLLGQAYVRLGKNREALEAFDRALVLDPNFADALGNRASVLAETGNFQEAVLAFDRALTLRPDSVEDWSNRGAALQALGRAEDALASYDRAVLLQPGMAGAHYNRGNILREIGQLEDAARPGSSPRGSTRFDAAEEAYCHAVDLYPDYAEAYLGRATARLLRGDWETGLKDYEHRASVGEPTYAPLNHPRWKGEPLADARLVLVSEGELADVIQFSRFAPLLAARGFDVTILTRKAMQPLLSTLVGVTIATSEDELARDKRPIRWLPMLSLPGVLGIRPATVPADAPYLAADLKRLANWQKRIGTAGLRIGIAWSQAGAVNRPTRNDMPLADFAPLLAIPGVRLISLQKGTAGSHVGSVSFRERIEAPEMDANEAGDFFLDAAAAMMHLDLIVTSDNAVAHLAGALGRPVFTALPAIADWRWLLGRDDSPWYPTMRLFRQSTRGDWSAVLRRVADAVQERAKR